MKQRPIRFAARVVLGMVGIGCAAAQFAEGDTTEGWRLLALVGAFAVYVVVLMRAEATER